MKSVAPIRLRKICCSIRGSRWSNTPNLIMSIMVNFGIPGPRNYETRNLEKGNRLRPPASQSNIRPVRCHHREPQSLHRILRRPNPSMRCSSDNKISANKLQPTPLNKNPLGGSMCGPAWPTTARSRALCLPARTPSPHTQGDLITKFAGKNTGAWATQLRPGSMAELRSHEDCTHKRIRAWAPRP